MTYIFSTEEVREINGSLPVHDVEFEYADLAIVFGTRFPMPVAIAADLLARGKVPLVVLTGGVNRQTGVVESLTHRDLLLAAGVTPQQIVVEQTSTNTLENVLFALPLIARVVDPGTVLHIAVIAKWHHCRRCLMTLKRWWPVPVTMYPCTYDQPGAPRDGWWLDEPGHATIGKDWFNTPRYLERGDLAEVEWQNGAYR